MFNYFSRLRKVYDNTEGCGDTLERVKVTFKLWCTPLYANFLYVVSHDGEGTLKSVVEATGAKEAVPVLTEAEGALEIATGASQAKKAEPVLAEEQKTAQDWNEQEFEDVEEVPVWDNAALNAEVSTAQLTWDQEGEYATSSPEPIESESESESEIEEEVVVGPPFDPIADAISKGVNPFAAQHERCAPDTDGSVPSLVGLHEFFIEKAAG